MAFIHEEVQQLESLETTEVKGVRYYKLPSGRLVPSVTTVVNFGNKVYIEKWKKNVGEEEANRITRISTSRGNALHNMVEQYLKNNEGYKNGVMPEPLSMFQSIKPFVDKIDHIRYLEAPLYSKVLNLAGRTDTIAEYDGVLSVIDYKNSRKVKTLSQIENYLCQATAYAIMHEELTGIAIDKLVIIMAIEGGQAKEFIQYKQDWTKKLYEAIETFNRFNKAPENTPPKTKNLFEMWGKD